MQNGMHINEDMFYPEVIDPETGKPVPDGVFGELVFTCIGKEALPLLRYRTKDICKLDRSLVNVAVPLSAWPSRGAERMTC